MLLSKNQYILFNSKRGNEKEGEKKERKIEKGMCGGAGRVTKVRNVSPLHGFQRHLVAFLHLVFLVVRVPCLKV